MLKIEERNIENLNKLSVADLKIVLPNVKLGEENLKKILSEAQFQALLNLSHLKKEEYHNIKTPFAEKMGTAMLVFNTILTSLLGIWLGLSAFAGFDPLTEY